MSKLNDNLRWAKNGHSHSNETNTVENNSVTLKLSNDRQQNSDAFKTIMQKHNAKQLIQNYDKITSQIKKSYPTQSSTKSDGRVLEKLQSTTDQNSIERFNIHPQTSQGFNNNSLTANLNVINDVSNFSNCSQTLTEPDFLNSTQNLGTSNCITESWKERNYVYEMKNAWLSYLNYSMTSQISPFINLHTISNPFVQVPTEVSRLASNDMNKAELLCRKRTETAVICWMISKFNTFSPL